MLLLNTMTEVRTTRSTLQWAATELFFFMKEKRSFLTTMGAGVETSAVSDVADVLCPKYLRSGFGFPSGIWPTVRSECLSRPGA
jgi:hypothetical protein